MNAEFPRTTYARAVREYDETFKRALIREILDAIAEASVFAFAAMSPHFDVPSHVREHAEMLAKRFRHEVAAARAEGRFDKIVLGAQRQGGRA
jgi:hypothetical protein